MPIPSNKNSALLGGLLALQLLIGAACSLSGSQPVEIVPETPFVFPTPEETQPPPPTATIENPASTKDIITQLTETPEVSPTPDTTPNPFFDYTKLGTTEKNLTYCNMEGVSVKMDVYYPYAATKSWPVVVLIHGGLWMSGDKSVDMVTRFAEPLRQAEYLAVSINYRLSPEYIYPAHLEDVKCAIRYLKAHPNEYNLDPNRVALLGFSSGGHLAAMAGVADKSAGFDTQGGYLEQSSRVQAVVDISGVSNPGLYCSPDTVWQVFRAESCDDRDKLGPANPANYITPDDPPFLIIHGNRDTAVDIRFSEYLRDHLENAGVLAIFYIVNNAGHSYDMSGRVINPSFDEIADFVILFLKAVIP